VLGVYAFTSGFPKQETYGLAPPDASCCGFDTSQHRRRLPPSGQAEKARFLNISEGSVQEFCYFLILVRDLRDGDTQNLSAALEEVSRLLHAYRAAILTSSTPDS
jgi:hypothetical protein